jgi:hypothetical protein
MIRGREAQERMSLPGDLVDRLEAALLDAFPDDEALDRLIRRVGLQARVPARAARDARVGKLVEAIDAQGRLIDLLDAARDLAPGNAIIGQTRPAILAQLDESQPKHAIPFLAAKSTNKRSSWARYWSSRTWYRLVFASTAVCVSLGVALWFRQPQKSESVRLTMRLRPNYSSRSISGIPRVGDQFDVVAFGCNIVWIYWNERKVIAGCPGDIACHALEDGWQYEMNVREIGRYRVVGAWLASAIPVPTGDVEADQATLLRGDARVTTMDIPVEVPK